MSSVFFFCSVLCPILKYHEATRAAEREAWPIVPKYAINRYFAIFFFRSYKINPVAMSMERTLYQWMLLTPMVCSRRIL